MRRTIIIMLAVVLVLVMAAGCSSAANNQANQKRQALNAWVAYWNKTQDVKTAFNRSYDLASRESQKLKGAVNRMCVFSTLDGECVNQGVGDLSGVQPTPELAGAHRQLMRVWRESGTTLTRSGRQMLKALKNPDPVYIIFGAGRKQINEAGTAAVRAEKRFNKAWNVWQRAAEAEGKRLGYDVSKP